MAAARRPNVLFIIADDHRYGAIGAQSESLALRPGGPPTSRCARPCSTG
jgi:arylsulfatase A-like enzyme